MSTARELTKQLLRQFVDSFDTILFDCDGVLWHGNDAISRGPGLISKLRAMGKQPLFVTNNSTKSRKQYIEKFNKLGFQVSEEEIFCTAYLAAIYMRNVLNFQGKAYLIGSPGMEAEFKLVDIEYTGTGRDYPEGDNIITTEVPLDKDITAVVVGFDNHMSMVKMTKAATYLHDPKVPLIATNTDSCLPMKNKNLVMPGTGTIVRAVETAAGRDALVLGKPNKFMVELIKKKFPLDSARTVMVGDRLNTDILLGKNCDLRTLMVLSGVSTLADVAANKTSSDETERRCIPDYYIEDVTTLDQYMGEL